MQFFLLSSLSPMVVFLFFGQLLMNGRMFPLDILADNSFGLILLRYDLVMLHYFLLFFFALLFSDFLLIPLLFLHHRRIAMLFLDGNWLQIMFNFLYVPLFVGSVDALFCLDLLLDLLFYFLYFSLVPIYLLSDVCQLWQFVLPVLHQLYGVLVTGL